MFTSVVISTTINTASAHIYIYLHIAHTTATLPGAGCPDASSNTEQVGTRPMDVASFFSVARAAEQCVRSICVVWCGCMAFAVRALNGT